MMEMEAMKQLIAVASRSTTWRGISNLAHAELAALREENGRLRQALGALKDVQNGPSLPKYENDWEQAMKLTEAVLGGDDEDGKD